MCLRKSLYDHCIEQGDDTLLKQWHPTKNISLTPRDVTSGSKRKIWWLCEKGHEWQAVVYTRTGGGSGCPYCAGKRAYPGENDLASQYPDIATQWHPTKNGSVMPDTVTTGSHREVWWLCEKGHEWRAMVKTRVEGTGCPVCANRVVVPGENDLETIDPVLAGQWHPAKNGKLTPRDVVPGTRRKAWWRCEKGHEWQAAVASRVNGVGCPVCAGKAVISGENDMATFYPDIAKEWHPTKNGTLTPETVSPYSNKKVWWRCALGHEYLAVIGLRTQRGDGCPYCAGRKVLPGFNDLATVEPEIVKQWHPTLNGALTPEMMTAGSHRKVWWQCPNGHTWKVVVYSRTGPGKSGCPMCAGRVKENRTERYAAMLLRDQWGENPLQSNHTKRSEKT